MTAARRVPAAAVAELAAGKILGVRAGDGHRFPGVWMRGFAEPAREVNTLELVPA